MTGRGKPLSEKVKIVVFSTRLTLGLDMSLDSDRLLRDNPDKPVGSHINVRFTHMTNHASEGKQLPIFLNVKDLGIHLFDGNPDDGLCRETVTVTWILIQIKNSSPPRVVRIGVYNGINKKHS